MPTPFGNATASEKHDATPQAVATSFAGVGCATVVSAGVETTVADPDPATNIQSMLFEQLLLPLSRRDDRELIRLEHDLKSCTTTGFLLELNTSERTVEVPYTAWYELLFPNTELPDLIVDAMLRLLLRDLDTYETTVCLPQSSLWLLAYKNGGVASIKNWAATEMILKLLPRLWGAPVATTVKRIILPMHTPCHWIDHALYQFGGYTSGRPQFMDAYCRGWSQAHCCRKGPHQ